MTNDNETTLSVEINLYPSDAPEKALRQVALGMQPLIILEPQMDPESEEITFVYTGSEVDSYEDLADMLGSFLEVLKETLEQNPEAFQ